MDEAVDPQVVALLFSGIVAMLLLALALVAFFLIYQKKLVSQQLALQTLQSAYQKELLAATIEAEERERERIGSDLHDEIGSSLSTAKMLMGQVADPATASAHEQEVAGVIKGILGTSVQNVRNISQNLHPAVLARFGLAEALRNLGVLCGEAFAQGITVDVDMAVALPQSQELALYRIAQELVNNALKHAQASQVRIVLAQQGQGLALTVADNGRGFDYALARQSKKAGLGLKSLEARVSMLNATLALESEPDQGTRILIQIPLSAQEC